MSNLFTKNLKRLKVLSSNAIYFNLPTLINALLPIIIIKYHDLSWWGHIVELTVVCAVCSIITAWGAKEYLLREFSDHPASAKSIWAALTNARALYVLLPICVVPFILFPKFVALNLMFWIIMRFIAQSYDAIIAFERRYTPPMIGELLNFCITVGGVIVLKDLLTYEGLLVILSCGHLIKAVILVFAFPDHSKEIFKAKAKVSELKAPYFYTLLTVTGMLAGKIDIIMMTLASGKETLAHYQIIISFLALIQSGAALLFQPYLKIFYRINAAGRAKMAKSLSLWGLSLCGTGLLVTYFILKYLYHITLSAPMIVTSFFYSLMPFLFVPLAYRIYRANRPDLVLRTSLLSVISFILMFSLVIHLEIADLETVLATVALHQIFTAVIYIFFTRRNARYH